MGLQVVLVPEWPQVEVGEQGEGVEGCSVHLHLHLNTEGVQLLQHKHSYLQPRQAENKLMRFN